MKLLTAKALSLAYIGRMPITAAATSMSRMAIHSRPMALRTRFLAASATSASSVRQNRYLATSPSSDRPKKLRSGTATEPEALSSVNHLMRRNIQSAKNCAASVATARYRPLTRKLGRPNKMPNSMAHTPPSTSATISGTPGRRIRML